MVFILGRDGKEFMNEEDEWIFAYLGPFKFIPFSKWRKKYGNET